MDYKATSTEVKQVGWVKLEVTCSCVYVPLILNQGKTSGNGGPKWQIWKFSKTIKKIAIYPNGITFSPKFVGWYIESTTKSKFWSYGHFKEGEDWYGLQTTNWKNLGLSFSGWKSWLTCSSFNTYCTTYTLTVSSVKCSDMCFLRWCLDLKAPSQWLHLKGSSSICDNSCVFR